MTPLRHTLALGLLIAATSWPGSSRAERKYPVSINSKPSGATIYLDDPDGEPLGTTPFSGRLPSGDYTLVFELNGYDTAIDSFSVRKTGRTQRITVTMQSLPTGYLRLKAAKAGEDLDGATVLIDGEMKDGGSTNKFDVPAGSHQVVVTKRGGLRFEAWVEIEPGSTTPLPVLFEKGSGAGEDDAFDFSDDTSTSNENPLRKDEPKIDKEVKTEPTHGGGDLVTFAGGIEWGGRSFKYDANARGLRNYNLLGARFRAGAVAYPLVRKNKWLGGFGVSASVGLLIFPNTSVTSEGENVGTKWFDFNFDARYRYVFDNDAWVAGMLGYGRDSFSFATDDVALQNELAEADYKKVEFGLLGGGVAGRISLGGSFKFYQVLDAGILAERFDGISVTAFGIQVGGSTKVYKGIDAAVSVFYNRYGITFGDPVGADYSADTGVDQLYGVMIGLGYGL